MPHTLKPSAVVLISGRISQYRITLGGGLGMRKLFSGAALAVMFALVLPVWSQTGKSPDRPTQQNLPGTGGTSKPGVPGLPGSKSGPTVTPSGTPVPDISRHIPNVDQSKVPGLPGSKSEPTVKPPNTSR